MNRLICKKKKLDAYEPQSKRKLTNSLLSLQVRFKAIINAYHVGASAIVQIDFRCTAACDAHFHHLQNEA